MFFLKEVTSLFTHTTTHRVQRQDTPMSWASSITFASFTITDIVSLVTSLRTPSSTRAERSVRRHVLPLRKYISNEPFIGRRACHTYTAPAPVTECAPAPVIEHVASALAVTSAVPAPVTEDVASSPAVAYSAHALQCLIAQLQLHSHLPRLDPREHPRLWRGQAASPQDGRPRAGSGDPVFDTELGVCILLRDSGDEV